MPAPAPAPTIRGRFLWHELMTTDVEAAKAFYTAAIGWGTQPFPASAKCPTRSGCAARPRLAA